GLSGQDGTDLPEPLRRPGPGHRTGPEREGPPRYAPAHALPHRDGSRPAHPAGPLPDPPVRRADPRPGAPAKRDKGPGTAPGGLPGGGLLRAPARQGRHDQRTAAQAEPGLLQMLETTLHNYLSVHA